MRDTDPGGAFLDPDDDIQLSHGPLSFVSAGAFDKALEERNESRRDADRLRAALADAAEVIALVYAQLSDLDRSQDGVERSMVAANELHHATLRLTAALNA